MTGWLRYVRAGARTVGIELSDVQVNLLAEYAAFLLERNRMVNLTGFRTRELVMSGLVLDSLTTVLGLPDGWREAHLTVVDVGSGGGAPGIPLAILFPGWNLTLIESIGKKADFLRDAVSHLGLSNTRVVAERAEVAGRAVPLRDAADLCVARAVAALPTLIELTAPLVRSGGMLLFPKSGELAGEIQLARRAARELVLRALDSAIVPHAMELGDDRVILRYEKLGATPERYPRRIGLARSRPIL